MSLRADLAALLVGIGAAIVRAIRGVRPQLDASPPRRSTWREDDAEIERARETDAPAPISKPETGQPDIYAEIDDQLEAPPSEISP